MQTDLLARLVFEGERTTHMRFVLWISALLGCVAASVFLLEAWDS